MRILHDIMEQLGEDTHGIYFAGKSPLHKKVVELRITDSSPSRFSTGLYTKLPFSLFLKNQLTKWRKGNSMDYNKTSILRLHLCPKRSVLITSWSLYQVEIGS